MLEVLDPFLSALARFLVARGVAFPDLAERLKGHYVQAAIARAEGKATDSRISVATGLQRRDVARLRGFQPKPARPSSPARLVARWHSEELPRELPRTGPAPSFEALALSVRKDVHPRTLLDTLAAAGTVAVEDEVVRLQQDSYQPQAGTEAQLAYLSKNLADHLDAASENVFGRSPPHFERAVHYTGLTPAQVEALRVAHASAQMDLLTRLNKQAARMKQDAQGAGSLRIRAGAFFFQKDLK